MQATASQTENALAATKIEPKGRGTFVLSKAGTSVAFIGGHNTIRKSVGCPNTITGDEAKFTGSLSDISRGSFTTILSHTRLAPLGISVGHETHQVKNMCAEHHRVLSATARIHFAKSSQMP